MPTSQLSEKEVKAKNSKKPIITETALSLLISGIITNKKKLIAIFLKVDTSSSKYKWVKRVFIITLCVLAGLVVVKPVISIGKVERADIVEEVNAESVYPKLEFSNPQIIKINGGTVAKTDNYQITKEDLEEGDNTIENYYYKDFFFLKIEGKKNIQNINVDREAPDVSLKETTIEDVYFDTGEQISIGVIFDQDSSDIFLNGNLYDFKDSHTDLKIKIEPGSNYHEIYAVDRFGNKSKVIKIVFNAIERGEFPLSSFMLTSSKAKIFGCSPLSHYISGSGYTIGFIQKDTFVNTDSSFANASFDDIKKTFEDGWSSLSVNGMPYETYLSQAIVGEFRSHCSTPVVSFVANHRSPFFKSLSNKYSDLDIIRFITFESMDGGGYGQLVYYVFGDLPDHQFLISIPLKDNVNNDFVGKIRAACESSGLGSRVLDQDCFERLLGLRVNEVSGDDMFQSISRDINKALSFK